MSSNDKRGEIGNARAASSEPGGENAGKASRLIWIIPLIAVIFIIVLVLFTRLLVGKDDSQLFDFFTTPFVPGESPHSTGPDSR